MRIRHSHCEEREARRSNHGFEIASLPAVARNDDSRHAGPAMTFWRRGQVSMEYAIIFAVTLAAIFATGIIDKSRDIFKVYFNRASGSITTISSGAQAGAAAREKAGGGEVALGPEATGAGGQPQDNGMAAIGKVAADAKVELASLKDTYAEKKGRYDKWRAIPIIGKLLPEFDNTRDGKILKMQIGAYEKVVEATSPLVKE